MPNSYFAFKLPESGAPPATANEISPANTVRFTRELAESDIRAVLSDFSWPQNAAYIEYTDGPVELHFRMGKDQAALAVQYRGLASYDVLKRIAAHSRWIILNPSSLTFE